MLSLRCLHATVNLRFHAVIKIFFCLVMHVVNNRACYTKQKSMSAKSKIEHNVKLHDSCTKTHAESKVHHATLKAELRPTDLRK